MPPSFLRLFGVGRLTVFVSLASRPTPTVFNVVVGFLAHLPEFGHW